MSVLGIIYKFDSVEGFFNDGSRTDFRTTFPKLFSSTSFHERDFKCCFTWYPTAITLCLWSGFIYPRIRTFDRNLFSRSLCQKEAFAISFMKNCLWNEAEVNFPPRAKLSQRDYLDYLKYEAKSGDMAVLEIRFRTIFLGNWSKIDPAAGVMPPS